MYGETEGDGNTECVSRWIRTWRGEGGDCLIRWEGGWSLRAHPLFVATGETLTLPFDSKHRSEWEKCGIEYSIKKKHTWPIHHDIISSKMY